MGQICLRVGVIVLGGETIVTDLYSSLEGQREKECVCDGEIREKSTKTRGDTTLDSDT
jgi:hypothetical protein